MRIYVEAINGKMYDRPIFYGENWYVNTTDTIRLTLKHQRRMTYASAEQKAKSALRSLGVKFSDLEIDNFGGSGVFKDSWETIPAVIFTFTLQSPTPVPEEHHGEYDIEIGNPDDKYITFSHWVSMSDIAVSLLSPSLVAQKRFLLKQHRWLKEAMRGVKEIDELEKRLQRLGGPRLLVRKVAHDNPKSRIPL